MKPDIRKIPVVYSKHYDITLLGLEKFHPFDTAKYSRVFRYLKRECHLIDDMFYEPHMVDRDDLLRVHTDDYLRSLHTSLAVASIAELSVLTMVPNRLLQEYMLDPMRYGTGGTILACQLALKYGWAINLSGGYHHATRDKGEGFCYFADIPLACHILTETHPSMKILVVDLDAHRGNGTVSIVKDYPNVFVFDLYNRDIFPFDDGTEDAIDYNFPVSSGIDDEAYLDMVRKNLPGILKDVSPGLVIFNAGTDVHRKDIIGKMNLTRRGIVERDSLVFSLGRRYNVPVAMVLSGGYAAGSAGIIGTSLEHLCREFGIHRH